MLYNAVELTRRLVRIQSTNPGGGEGRMGDFLCGLLEDAGVAPEKSEVLPGRFNIRAVQKGRKASPALIFICHMDTVVKGDGWTRDAFDGSMEDGRIWGRGSCDMKSGLACALSAFMETAQKVKKEETILEYPLVFIGTVDEEGDMQGVEKVIQDGWVDAKDWVLDMEPTDGCLSMAHKGRTWFEVEVQGITAHASMPEKGADAIAGMAEIIHSIREKFESCPVHTELGRSTVTFGQIQGGYSPYVVPDHCKVTVDMRLVPPMDTKWAEEMVHASIIEAENTVKGTKAGFQVTGDRPALETHRESLLLNAVLEAGRCVTGKEPKVSVFPGYTDTAVIAGKTGNQNCMSYGPGSLAQAHKPDEFVITTEIQRCQEVLLILIEKMLTKERAL